MNRGGATHVPSAALSFVFPYALCFVVVVFIFARRALPLSSDCVAICRNISALSLISFQWYYFHQSVLIRSSVTYLSCSLFGSLSNRGFWRKSSFVHGNKSFDLGNVSADVDFKCTLWDIFTLRRGMLSCFFFFPPLFLLWQTRFFVCCPPIFLSMFWNLDETLSVIEEAVLSILLGSSSRS